MEKWSEIIKNMLKVVGILGLFILIALLIEEYFVADALVPAIMVLAVFVIRNYCINTQCSGVEFRVCVSVFCI